MFPQSIRARVVFYTRCGLMLTRSSKKWRMNNTKSGNEKNREKTGKIVEEECECVPARMHANTANYNNKFIYSNVYNIPEKYCAAFVIHNLSHSPRDNCDR